jgi:hypothetical protein
VNESKGLWNVLLSVASGVENKLQPTIVKILISDLIQRVYVHLSNSVNF